MTGLAVALAREAADMARRGEHALDQGSLLIAALHLEGAAAHARLAAFHRDAELTADANPEPAR